MYCIPLLIALMISKAGIDVLEDEDEDEDEVRFNKGDMRRPNE
jgi:hypothetical protein